MHNGFHVKGLREHAGAESLDSSYLALEHTDQLARVQIRRSECAYLEAGS